jgi:hypothetical protein
MKRILTATLILFTAIIAPAVAAAATDQKAKTTAPAKAPVAVTIPKDAVANPDGTWSWKDKQGKHWIYTKTPFGVSKVAAGSTANAKSPAGIPKDAVRNADGSFTATDKDGKKWNYQNTPFGVSRTAALPVSDWKVIDKGDTVRFERQGGPMGPSVWEKKKTELNDEERSVYEAHQTAGHE